MKKNNDNYKYWENEESEVIKFGKNFIRYFEKSGKLQFGRVKNSPEGESLYVLFVLDRSELIDSDEGLPYIREVLDEWNEYEED